MSNQDQAELLIVQHDTVLLRVDVLQPHPLNRPATGVNREHVDTLKTMIQQSGYNASKPLTVRQIGDVYQIIEGHHRWHAATELGYAELPCVIEELDDTEASLRLLVGNQQTGNDPLDIGLTALATVVKSNGGRGVKSEMSVSAFAERLGKSQQVISNAILAARVHQKLTIQIVSFETASIDFSTKLEIGRAPEWMWVAFGMAAMEGKWNKDTAKQMVGNYKAANEPPDWCDAEAIAVSLLSGQLSIPDLAKLYSYPDRVNVVDDDIKKSMWADLRAAHPSRMSTVQGIANKHEQEQAKRLAAIREAEAAIQRQKEEAFLRVARLRKNCSLDEWKGLNKSEREMLQFPSSGEGGTFNQQKGDSIEWAQWSWNPVTGCKHDCPYCYARDIALSERMQQAGLYPNGWEPTFRSEALNAPRKTRVPKEAETDTRFKNVFTCSMADLFGRWVPAEWIEAVMLAVKGSPQWNFLFLTKFPQRFADLDIPDNAWLGTTVDLQARVANAEKAFAKVTGGVRWLSVEPMIEPIRLERPELFNWVVIGGASASKQTPEWRPPYRWIESLVRQCDDAGVPVYMKSNLGIANRVLQLPFAAPVKGDPQQAPSAFHYHGNRQEN